MNDSLWVLSTNLIVFVLALQSYTGYGLIPYISINIVSNAFLDMFGSTLIIFNILFAI
jgi:hypothetical protein